MTCRIEARLYGQKVGILTKEDRRTGFRFDQSYLDLPQRPVLGQKFEEDLEKTYRGRASYKPLPDFFANLIPEGQLRTLLEQQLGLRQGDDLALLASVGQDLPGAIALPPTEEGSGGESRGGKADRKDAEESSGADSGEDASRLRFSLAGVQMKFSMLLQEDKLTLPAHGVGGNWIVKFDTAAYPHLPVNEYSMLEWARRSGFDVPACELRPAEQLEALPRRYAPEGTQVLAIRRYDRTEAGPVHQEDLCQARGLPPDQKYEQMTYEAMAVLARALMGEKGVDEQIRRLSLVIACGNNDAHLKNWSLIYPDRIRAAWSPLYDQVSTVAWPAPARELSLKLAGVKAFGRIDRAAFDRFAERAKLPPKRVHDLVSRTLETLRDVWRNEASELPLPPDHRARLREHWQAVPLLREMGPLPED